MEIKNNKNTKITNNIIDNSNHMDIIANTHTTNNIDIIDNANTTSNISIVNNLDILENVKITDMHYSDLELIKDILITDFDDFWNYNVFKTELENINSKYVVAKLNNEIIGFAGIWKVLDEAHITNIVTKKLYRNKGVATVLLEYLISLCKNSKEITSLTLEVSEDNFIAQNLYKKFNFKILGKRKKYYKDKSALIMTLHFES